MLRREFRPQGTRRCIRIAERRQPLTEVFIDRGQRIERLIECQHVHARRPDGGRRLVQTKHRHTASALVGRTSSSSIYLAVLDKTQPSPFAPESDEEKAAEDKKAAEPAKADTASAAWARAEGVARLAIANVVPSVGSDVLWYHANYVAPSWGRRLTRVSQIGAHIFYRA